MLQDIIVHLLIRSESKKMKLSIAMATYNGVRHLPRQLCSICEQLQVGDEIIVVDDASDDETVELVKSFLRDAQREKKFDYQVIEKNKNSGVVETFQTAIVLCSKDVVVLADQDDVFLENRLNNIRAAFRSDPDLDLWVQDAFHVDDKLELNGPRFQQLLRPTDSILANFYKNRFLGATMSFRIRSREKFLPIHRFAPMHDVWIGIMIKLLGGKITFSDSVGIMFVRHGMNHTPKRRPLFKLIKSRFKFLWALFYTCITKLAVIIK